MQKDVKNFVFFIQSDILLLYFDFMTRIPYTLIALLSSLFFSINTYAAEDNILWVSQDRLRNGDITYADIPLMIVSAIEFLLAVAGSISVVALIYHAVRMQLASGITGDSSGVDKAKKWIYGAMLGFVLSMSGWFLMTKFVALLSSAT